MKLLAIVEVALALPLLLFVVGAVIGAPLASADDPGCQTVPWGLFHGKDRTLCDGPI